MLLMIAIDRGIPLVMPTYRWILLRQQDQPLSIVIASICGLSLHMELASSTLRWSNVQRLTAWLWGLLIHKSQREKPVPLLPEWVSILFFLFYSNTWSSYLMDLLSLVGEVGASKMWGAQNAHGGCPPCPGFQPRFSVHVTSAVLLPELSSTPLSTPSVFIVAGKKRTRMVSL